MKAETLNHPKLLSLADSLRGYLQQQCCSLSPPVAKSVAIGLLEQLWHFTTAHTPAGDIGKHCDAAISGAVGWEHDAGWLIEQLVELRLLDRDDEHRLVVHNWSRRCDATCHRFVADEGIPFADGGKTYRKPRRNSPAGRLLAQKPKQKSQPDVAATEAIPLRNEALRDEVSRLFEPPRLNGSPPPDEPLDYFNRPGTNGDSLRSE